ELGAPTTERNRARRVRRPAPTARAPSRSSWTGAPPVSAAADDDVAGQQTAAVLLQTHMTDCKTDLVQRFRDGSHSLVTDARCRAAWFLAQRELRKRRRPDRCDCAGPGGVRPGQSAPTGKSL